MAGKLRRKAGMENSQPARIEEESVANKRKGIKVRRYFTRPGVHPFAEIEWEKRSAVISGEKGEVVFEQHDVEIPKSWSQLATNVVVSKYFRGALGTPQREHSVRQLISRVVDTITAWGRKDGYFASEEDARIFADELTHLLVGQKLAFNSPVWFNVGVEPHPQCSACFILSVEDRMESILDWYRKEGIIFKGGSGSGVNLSKLRSSKERLAGGGTASGPVSFMRAADASAGVIKSGGKCFKKGTLVSTPNGWVPIEMLHIGDLVLTHKGPRPIADFMPNGQQPCYKVRTAEGYEVEVTRGHKFAYWHPEAGRFEVKPIEEFAKGASLYILLEASEGGVPIPLTAPEANGPPQATTTVEMQFPTELNNKLAYIVGLLYGDAEVRTQYPYRVRVAFCKDEAGRASAERFRAYCADLFGEEPLLLGDEANHQQLGFTRKRLVEFLTANNLAKGKAKSLGFPKVLFQARPAVRAAFIAGVIDADGTYRQRGGWSVSSIDRSFLAELQRLLLTLGIPSKIKLNREAKGDWQPLYRLHVVGHTFVERLVKQIAPYSAKAAFHYVPSDRADKGWGYRPSLFSPLVSRIEQRGGYRLIERKIGLNETTGYGALACLTTHPDAAVADYAEELCHCVQVTLESVELTSIEETYDIEVEDVHLLCANGFYASNTRRAAKMVVLNVDHPDIVEFIQCKVEEERKAWTLIEAGYDASIDGAAYSSIFFQNANNSVRVTDDFMRAIVENRSWSTRFITTGEVCETFQAREVLRKIAEATWRCGDPGMQFDTTINAWHTCPNSGRINATNPCGEYNHLDDSACNLASLNLMKFIKDDSGFDSVAFKHAVDISITAQDILVDNSSYPTAEITANAKAFRELGLGYANLGALLMSLGLPYDSEAGRQYAGAITALMTGEAYLQSARLAEPMGPFSGYAVNREPMLGVIDKHRSSAHKLDPSLVPLELLSEARKVWDEALTLGRKVGYRNSQATVLAPTGTIAFMMDCDTTGVEPDIALVKYKRLVGGGLLKIVNHTVPRALKRLGYDNQEVQAMVEYIDEHETIEGAPLLRDEHLPVFDCAFKPTRGSRSIHYLGHLRMMGAVQPFISGAISKTINMPNDATVEDISEAYMEAWHLGLKAVAIYRDGCKKVQPLATGEKKTAALPVVVAEPTPVRRRLPMERTAICHKFDIAGHEGYIHVGFYEDGTPGEIFIKMAKEGSTISGLMDTIATLTSLALQYGVPLEALVSKFSHVRFEPSGFTKNPDIPYAKSLTDYIFRFLGARFLSTVQKQEAGLVEGNEQRPVADESQMSPRRAPDLPWTGSRLASDRPLTPWQSQADAPSCADCGSIMIRNGSCYKCLNCGATSGCS